MITAQFRAILDSSIDGVIVVSERGEVVEFNAPAEAMFGWTRDEALGRCAIDLLVPAPLRDEHRDELARYAAEARDGTIVRRRREGAAVARDGRAIEVELSVTSARVTDALRFVVVVRDITERNAGRRALVEARDAAQEAARAKTLFLAAMSHEIRTPMNAVIGLTELLLDSGLDPHQRSYAEMVQASGENLLQLIDDVLEYSKADAGGLVLERRPLDLRDCLEQAIDVTAPAAAAKGIELCHAIEGPTAVLGDVARLRQVLVNLLSNAVKFTDAGEVELRAATRPLADGRVEVRLTVRDTGIGIRADQAEALFDPFRQADASTTRKYGGTGLGLAIVRHLAEAMDGAVSARPGAQGGSVFEVVVRLAAGRKPLFDVPAMRLRGRTVAIATANPAVAATLATTVTGWGATVADHADVLVTDLPMTFAGPVVTLTAFGDRDAARIPHAVPKPVKALALRTALVEALTGRDVPRDEPRTTAARATRPLAVLLAEDNAVNQFVGRQTLEKLGHAVTVVADGAAAVAAAEHQAFDVILMDVEMPELDGLEATRRIRARHEHQPLIVGVTASAFEEDRERCLAAGMDAYLAKPLRGAELAATLATLDVVLDPAALRHNAGDDDEIAAELAALFVAEQPARTAGLEAAAAREDLDALRGLAHGLRSGALVLGLTRLVAAATELERSARAGATAGALGGAHTVLRELERATAALHVHIRSSTAPALPS